MDSTTLRPTKIGKYLIESILGSGAMGVVFQGFDPEIERRVAIKTIHANLLKSSDAQDYKVRFKREAQAAGRCLHPNIATVFDYGEEADIPFIAMELIHGQELRQFIKSGHQFGLGQTLSIARQILSALECAHANNVIHRDIKPSNIILQNNGAVKVTDFGVAGLDVSDMTMAGTIVGTPGYMAPEQIQGQKADSRADLYSTAAVMLEMLTGKRPEKETFPRELIGIILAGVPEDQKAPPPLLPGLLETLFDRGLAQDRNSRFQNAAEFSAHLEKFTPVSATRTQTAFSDPDVPPPPADNVWLDRETTIKLEQELTKHIGPIAPLVLKKAAARTDDPEQLLLQISLSLPEGQRPALIRKLAGLLPAAAKTLVDLRSSGSLSNSSSSIKSVTGFNLPVLEQATKDLAGFLGPIAKILVKQTSRQAVNTEDLYRQLAEHIDIPEHRRAFLSLCPVTKN